MSETKKIALRLAEMNVLSFSISLNRLMTPSGYAGIVFPSIAMLFEGTLL